MFRKGRIRRLPNSRSTFSAATVSTNALHCNLPITLAFLKTWFADNFLVVLYCIRCISINKQQETSTVPRAILQVCEEAVRAVILLADAWASREMSLRKLTSYVALVKIDLFISPLWPREELMSNLPKFAGTSVGGLFPIHQYLNTRKWAGSSKERIHYSDSPYIHLHTDNISPFTSPMRHSYIWPLLQNFILEGDIIVTELGTAFFSAPDIRLPTGACIIAQYLSCTIGFEAAASCGGTVAAHRATSSSNGLAQ